MIAPATAAFTSSGTPGESLPSPSTIGGLLLGLALGLRSRLCGSALFGSGGGCFFFDMPRPHETLVHKRQIPGARRPTKTCGALPDARDVECSLHGAEAL